MASVVTRAGTIDVDIDVGDDDALGAPGVPSVLGAPPGDIERRVRGAVGEHYDFVWRSLRRLGVPEASADDAAQQVFCVFAKRVRDVPPEKEKTFLFGVVMRVAQATRRQSARRSTAEVVMSRDDDILALEESVASNEAGPDELLEERRARVLLDALLAELPIDLRAVFVLYEIEELTMAEIAKVLDLPPGTVASRLRRAREVFEELSRSAMDDERRSLR